MATAEARHRQLHAAFDAQLDVALVAILERDGVQATTQLRLFRQSIAAHAHIEEAHVLPLMLPLLPTDGPKSPKHIVPEHVLLLRLIDELLEAVTGLFAEPNLRTIDLLELLPLMVRLRGAYEHHSVREAQLYAALNEDPATASAVLALENAR